MWIKRRKSNGGNELGGDRKDTEKEMKRDERIGRGKRKNGRDDVEKRYHTSGRKSVAI